MSAGGRGLRNRLYVRQLLLLLLLLVVVLDAVRLLSSSSSSSSLATLSTTSQRRCQLDDRPHDCSRRHAATASRGHDGPCSSQTHRAESSDGPGLIAAAAARTRPLFYDYTTRASTVSVNATKRRSQFTLYARIRPCVV